MDGRKKTFFPLSLVAVAVVTVPGCGFNQQSKFQMSFLPPLPHLSEVSASDVSPSPVPQPNVFLQDLPAFLLTAPAAPLKRSVADSSIQLAERHFEAGKKLYQAKEFANARVEFDTAVDLMLHASNGIPGESAEYDRKLDEMVDAIHRYDLAGLGASANIEDSKYEKTPLEDILQMTFPVDPKLKNRVREEMAATVSQLPLAINDTVLGYINYFANRGHYTLVSAYQRSGMYRPMIQRVLGEEGVPQELIHLAQAESGFIPHAMSRKAAVGMWQFVAFRGQEYGLAQTRYADDRMDPEMATRAAARHLHDLYNEFGDWYLAIAAYNCGPGVVEKAVERTGYADFWELRSRGMLPIETANYVPIILAMTIMEKNAPAYGLDAVTMDTPLQYDTVNVASMTSLQLVSDIIDRPVSELASLNPALFKAMVPEGHSLHVPKGLGNQLMSALDTVPAEHRAEWRMHRVAGDDTLASIGKRYGVSPSSIMTVNRLLADRISEGDRLIIPAVQHVPAPAARRPAVRTAAAHPGSTARRSATAVAGNAHPAATKSASSTTAARKPATIIASR